MVNSRFPLKELASPSSASAPVIVTRIRLPLSNKLAIGFKSNSIIDGILVSILASALKWPNQGSPKLLKGALLTVLCDARTALVVTK